jgi:hypothetical protein
MQHGVCLHVNPDGVWGAKLLFHTHVQNPEFCLAQWNAVAPCYSVTLCNYIYSIDYRTLRGVSPENFRHNCIQ